MKKNNKGFFLAETIIMLALVTTVMAFVYPNLSKLYDNYKNVVHNYDQTEDLYLLKAVYEANKSTIDNLTSKKCNEVDEIGAKSFANNEKSNNIIKNKIIDPSGNIDELYITGYMTDLSSDNYNFNKYLKRLKRTTSDYASYRLIVVIGDRYASIKIDNPNPNRHCNLGGSN